MLFLATKALQSTSETVDFKEIFFSSPFIYAILLALSISSFSLWIYCLMTFRSKEILPEHFLSQTQKLLKEKNYKKAVELCETNSHIFAKMLSRGVETKDRGLDAVLQSMESQGKKSMAGFWQKLSLLNDIAVISPMFGLLGTILGMFYGFYDINRSVESIHALFDGLGMAIGTTVAGLIVAISSMIFYAILKHKLVHLLHILENESLKMGHLLVPFKEL